MSTAEDMAENMADDLRRQMLHLGARARAAASVLAKTPTAAKDKALGVAATAMRDGQAAILEANATDMAAAEKRDLTTAMLDRLLLTPERIEAMAAGLEAIAGLADPVGDVISEWDRPNGLRISRVRVPLGVIGIIYESRPNVTADAGALCLKSGNAAILRGGSESFYSSHAIHGCLLAGLRAAGLPEGAIQLLPTQDRAAVGMMLTMPQYIDIIVPRGGKGLIERVQAESRIPVIAHLDGNCHVYIDGSADLAMARDISLNAKLRRVGICGASETLLVDQACAATHLAPLVTDLLDAGCEVRGDGPTQQLDPRVVPATDADWKTEYLDTIIAVKVVDGVENAIEHIEEHGSHHTDCIVAGDVSKAERFLNEVDSAILLHNASTQFADGGEFGMGAEIGISTNRLHARGPVGVEQLTSYKYVVHGQGQIRP
jgi:glutamate-5-semialdehyde dehydrogenase